MSGLLRERIDFVRRMAWGPETLPSGAEVWVARDLDYDGCLAQSDSEAGVLAALEEARDQYVAALVDLGRPVPARPRPTTLTRTATRGVGGAANFRETPAFSVAV
jgi:predicted RNase H-like HicB family nuclease